MCSNNWQSAVNNEPINEPSTSSHVAGEPVGLDQVAPLPKVVRRLPDFDQESWTVDAHPKTETEFSLTALSLDQTNNNNNNHTFCTPGQSSSQQSAVKSQVYTEQTFSLVFTSNQTDELPSPSRTHLGTNSLPSAARDYTQTPNAAASLTNSVSSLTSAVSPPFPQASAIPDGTKTADPEATGITTSGDALPDSQKTSETP